MAANSSRRTPVSPPKRVLLLLLLGALGITGIVYFSLPKSWFEIPDDSIGTARKSLHASESPSQPASQDTQSLTAERLIALRAEAAKSPQDFGARSRYGMALSSNGRGSEALAEFQAAARLAPDVPGVHHNLGVYYLNMGRLATAETQFRRELEIVPGDGRAHYYRGLILQAQHRDQEAVGQFREAVALAPQLPDAYLALAIQITRSNDEGQIRALADNYARLTGDKAMADYVVSGAYRTWKKYPEAARYAEMTVQEVPDNYGYWHNLGQIYSYARRWDEADRALNRARALTPDPTTSLIELGMNAQGALRFESAESYLKSALAASPRTGNIHSYLAHLYRQWNKEAEARKEEKMFRHWELENTARRRRAGVSTPPVR